MSDAGVQWITIKIQKNERSQKFCGYQHLNQPISVRCLIAQPQLFLWLLILFLMRYDMPRPLETNSSDVVMLKYQFAQSIQNQLSLGTWLQQISNYIQISSITLQLIKKFGPLTIRDLRSCEITSKSLRYVCTAYM